MSATRIPYRCGRARGFRYGEVPPEVERALPRWLETRHVEEGATIKATRVYRFGGWIVKFTGASRRPKDVLRRASAIRIADLHAKLQPIRTPVPLVALELRRGPFLEKSLLVSELVAGPSLAEAWSRHERAVDSFPAFLALLHRRGVFHGDLHPKNLIWNGSEWVLIDLAALRHPLRRLAQKRLILEQWSQLAFRLAPPERVRACFVRYLSESGLAWDPGREWERVLARAHRIRAQR